PKTKDHSHGLLSLLSYSATPHPTFYNLTTDRTPSTKPQGFVKNIIQNFSPFLTVGFLFLN
ncbi:MAG: hypothetical protein WCL61_02875, partial [bacterium]